MDGVLDVAVDFATKTATVTMKAGAVLTADQCTRAFAGSPYTVESLEPVP